MLNTAFAPHSPSPAGAVELARALVRANTINPPGNEDGCARMLGGMLQTAGFDVEYHEFAPRRMSLVATIGGGEHKPRLAFTGHLDTVPLGAAAWSVDPFGAEIADGKIYGRGTSDMKAGIAAFVSAACRLAPRLPGTPGLALIVTAGEETGSEGARYLVRQNRPAMRGIGALVVAEPTGNYPIVGHRGVLWLHACAKGVAAHGSMPEKGDNAIYKAARAVCALQNYSIGKPHYFFGRTTLNVGTISGGANINSVPDEARFGIDIRTVPGVDHAATHAVMQGDLGADVDLQPALDLPGVFTDPDHPWIQEVFQVAGQITGETVVARGAPYFTDASVFTHALGQLPTVIYGPGEPEMAHQTDEYCRVARILESVEAYEQLIASWCGLRSAIRTSENHQRRHEN